jgi:serine/threonine protein kinase
MATAQLAAPTVDDRSRYSTLKDFEFQEKIGHGAFGTVYRVRRKGMYQFVHPAPNIIRSHGATCRNSTAVDSNVYVIKKVKILLMSRKEQEAAINEVRIMASLDNSFVIKYYDSFIDGDSLNIVMELAEHGNLSAMLKVSAYAISNSAFWRPRNRNHLQRHRSNNLSENMVWKIFIQMTLGLYRTWCCTYVYLRTFACAASVAVHTLTFATMLDVAQIYMREI